MDKCFLNHKLVHKVDFDPWSYTIKEIDKTFFIFLLTTLTKEQIVLVPRNPISTEELFMIPFQWQVWATILVLLLVFEAVTLIFPSIFRNDPFLLAICGFERYNLHKARCLERILFISLIALMFFIIRAYETKFLSFMMSKPVTRDIRTIQDLVDFKAKIKYNRLATPFVDDQRELNGLLVNSNDSLLKMDLIHAYIAERSLSQLKLLPRYYDPVNKLYRYSIMEQTLGMFSVVYEFAPRSPLIDSFGYALTVFIESGIFSYWHKMFEYQPGQYSRFYQQTHFSRILLFDDIFSVLSLTSYGFVVSSLTFIIEVSFCKLKLRCMF